MDVHNFDGVAEQVDITVRGIYIPLLKAQCNKVQKVMLDYKVGTPERNALAGVLNLLNEMIVTGEQE